VERRDFLKAGSVSLAGAALGRTSAANIPPIADAKKSGRVVLPINRGWLFSRQAPERGAEDSLIEQGMEKVNLPHSNARFSWHNFDEKSYQTVSLYRRHLQIPELASGARVFLDFEGAMAASRLWVNGEYIGEYKGGYTPFSFEITRVARSGRENLLAVEVDGRENSLIPPFGYEIDYLTFGGIYREVSLRIVNAASIENLFARPKNVLSAHPGLEVEVFLDSADVQSRAPMIEVQLTDGDGTVASTRQQINVPEGASRHIVELRNLPGIALWSLESPRLYGVYVRLLDGDVAVDEDHRRVGFRTAEFTEHGFELNGKPLKLRGLNRHQTYPYVGGAMPRRVQRRDAEILKRELKCNIVRTSHYPPSRHFMDACDELGLLVLEEIPGWQHVGEEKEWQDHAVENVRRMICRDWNRPSVILWSIRINESRDFHDLYVRTNTLARTLDPTRQTCGVRYFQESEFLEDVFCMNDFKFPLKSPNHARYLNTEFVGAEWPVRSSDNNDGHKEHIVRYAQIYDQLQTNLRYAGGLGWCAFDYATHRDFGSGDRICYHGVMDIFREPKPAAGFYKSQCSPQEEVVLEAGFHWAMNDGAGDFHAAPICSNCDTIKCSIGNEGKWHQIIELKPDRKQFPHLAYPPFFLTLPNGNDDWGDLRLDGYINGELRIRLFTFWPMTGSWQRTEPMQRGSCSGRRTSTAMCGHRRVPPFH
jgi:beta-galactosidase